MIVTAEGHNNFGIDIPYLCNEQQGQGYPIIDIDQDGSFEFGIIVVTDVASFNALLF